MATKNKTPIEQLSREARGLLRRLKEEWQISDAAGELTLLTLCQCLDRLREAQAVIATDGAITMDKWGQKKVHPAAVIERESRAGMLACMKALNLDVEGLE